MPPVLPPHSQTPANTLAERIQHHLRSLPDPFTGQDWVSSKCLKDIRLAETPQGWSVELHLALPYPARSLHDSQSQRIAQHLRALEPLHDVQVQWSTHVLSHASRPGVARLPGVKNLVAIASGKGGVGKSTTAVNVALALQAEGARVGLLDADIYGPSQPLMMGLAGKPDSPDGKTISPLVNHGLQVMSMGLLIDDEAPTIWRGPMATQGLDQLLRLTRWGAVDSRDGHVIEALDYLIVDMPPGTGDIHLSLCQRSPLTAAVIVTTPQDIALLDATKGLRMFDKMGVPVLGVIENMAVYHCPACGHEAHIFGEHGGQRMAAERETTFLGSLPLSLSIREGADRGQPTMVSEPDSPTAELYRRIAHQLSARLSLLPKDYSSKLPPIAAVNPG